MDWVSMIIFSAVVLACMKIFQFLFFSLFFNMKQCMAFEGMFISDLILLGFAPFIYESPLENKLQ